jgi:hypothetical protein
VGKTLASDPKALDEGDSPQQMFLDLKEKLWDFEEKKIIKVK